MRPWLSARTARAFAFSTALFALFISTALGAGFSNCHEAFYQIAADTYRSDRQIVPSFESALPIRRAFEKEGLMYRDIVEWFDTIDKEKFTEKMTARLKKEQAFARRGNLMVWLDEYADKYRPVGSDMKPKAWAALSYEDRIKYLSDTANPFDRINPRGRENLFYDAVLTYDEVKSSGITPSFLTVGDDLGSYEVRSVAAEADRVKYLKDRDLVETAMESRVGHQHFFHGWPKTKEAREKIAGQYLENLDATSWYFYWRNINNNSSGSILFHPYQGVYERDMLERLEKAFVEGKPEDFKQKYRTIGARSFKARPGDETDGWSHAVSFETRSGNKTVKRDYIADVMEARLSTGDYSGLRSFHSYDFDASTPSPKLFANWLEDKQIQKIEEFEKAFPNLEYSDHARAYNHFRNRVLSPLLPWENRLDLEYKKDVLKRAQARFANNYFEIASEYMRRSKGKTGEKLSELRAEVREKLERINWLFARRVRLDKDFEHYLMPYSTNLPSIRVKTNGPIDVNKSPIGIEASFRFPEKPRDAAHADAQLKAAAEAFAKEINAKSVEKAENAGHGHGLSIRYLVTDQEDKKWRIEWDGVQRTYNAKGKVTRAFGGHIEAPTPKIVPDDMSEIAPLFRAMRHQGNYPSRAAGGGHFNVGLEQLFELPSKEAAARMSNLLRVFEENREIIGFLWQHPFRQRVAMPVPYDGKFVKAINNFKGDWKDLQYLLYENQYFNPYITRKPAYIQMNTTGLMADVVPQAYKKSIDIKKAGEKDWFPSFSKGGTDRVEWRMPDAMLDEHMQALEIKFFRALLERGLNGEKVVLHSKKGKEALAAGWRNDPKSFFAASDEFLISLGLSPDEFRPAQVQAMQQQLAKSEKAAENAAKRAALRRANKFLPPIEKKAAD